jgi:hypothetical protein
MHVQFDSCDQHRLHETHPSSLDACTRHMFRREYVVSFVSACLRLTICSMKAWGKLLDPSGSSGVRALSCLNQHSFPVSAETGNLWY